MRDGCRTPNSHEVRERVILREASWTAVAPYRFSWSKPRNPWFLLFGFRRLRASPAIRSLGKGGLSHVKKTALFSHLFGLPLSQSAEGQAITECSQSTK